MHQPLQCLYFLYHELRHESGSYSYAIDSVAFDRHIDLFASIRAGGTTSVLPEITFDDGHASDYEIALPILQSHGLSARFFVTAGWTGKRRGYMDRMQLRALQDGGQIIGGHGWTHTLLTHCSEAQLRQELEGTRLSLEDHLGSMVSSMSLPGGRYNQRVLDACIAAGYTEIFTSIPRVENLPAIAAVADGNLIGRLNILQGMSLEQLEGFLKQDSKTLASLGRMYHFKQLAKSMMGDRLYKKLWAMVSKQDVQDGEAMEG